MFREVHRCRHKLQDLWNEPGMEVQARFCTRTEIQNRDVHTGEGEFQSMLNRRCVQRFCRLGHVISFRPCGCATAGVVAPRKTCAWCVEHIQL